MQGLNHDDCVVRCWGCMECLDLSLRQDRGLYRLTEAPLGLMHLGQGQREANASPTRADISGSGPKRG